MLREELGPHVGALDLQNLLPNTRDRVCELDLGFVLDRLALLSVVREPDCDVLLRPVGRVLHAEEHRALVPLLFARLARKEAAHVGLDHGSRLARQHCWGA